MTTSPSPDAPSAGRPHPAPPVGCPAHPGTDAVPLSGPRFHTDPLGLYRDIRREHGPVVPVELGGFPAWLVIGYRELHQVTSDPVLFPRDVGLWNQWENIPPDWPLLPMVGQRQPSIYYTVGAEHRRHCEMAVPALEGVDLFELRGVTERLADELIDGFCGRGSAELVSEYAVRLPVLALARIIGFPFEDGPEMARVLNALADGGADAQQAHVRFGELIQRLVETRRAQPGADVTSRMLAHPEPFTEQEYMLDLMAVTAAGHLPTADWLGNSIRLMLTDDRFAASLGGGRHSVAQAMNEVLWEDTPTQILSGRWAARDTQLGGRAIRTGDMLLLGLAGANADPAVRQHGPRATDGPHTGNSAHFAFSYGEYRCPFPAQEIAEVIARTGIEVLLDRLPDLDLAVPAPTLARRPSAFLRGMSSLPVRFTPVPTTGGHR